jgi:hypothetical protein
MTSVSERSEQFLGFGARRSFVATVRFAPFSHYLPIGAQFWMRQLHSLEAFGEFSELDQLVQVMRIARVYLLPVWEVMPFGPFRDTRF